MLYSTLLVAIVVCSMLFCMLYELLQEEAATFPGSFSVFYVKLPCAIALHLCLYPEVAKGMELMKLANMYSGYFVDYGSEISFIVGFIQVFTALLTEYINIKLLTAQHTVEHCIIHFVALEVIMEVSSLYYESLMHNKLKKIVHHTPEIRREDKIEFKNKSLYHKIARLFYKLLKLFYVSIIYYFIPFSVIYAQFGLELGSGLH